MPIILALKRLIIASIAILLSCEATGLDNDNENMADLPSDKSIHINPTTKSVNMLLLQMAFSEFQKKLYEIDSAGIEEINEVSTEV